MALLRIFLLAFNVGIVTFLIYRLLQIFRSQSSRKGIILIAGIFLLLVPVAMVAGLISITPVYILIYPVSISLFLYLIKEVG